MKRENANIRRDLISIAIIFTMLTVLFLIAGALQKAHAAEKTIAFTWQLNSICLMKGGNA